jgi:3',5'-cyclic AMP phosphodiesterase CpdA
MKTSVNNLTSCDSNHPQMNCTPASKFVLVHLSDPHISCINSIKKRDLLNKRILGYLRWRLFRKRAHQDEILSSLQADLELNNPDHIVITGDLTHLGLPAEFAKARGWLRSLGTSDHVTVIPGNHDAYVRSDWNQTFAQWTDYMASDKSDVQSLTIKRLDDLFPTLRVRGKIAFIGICSAYPCAPHLAVGSLGDAQLNKLEKILRNTAEQGLFRILLIHHPPLPDMESWRRCLTDVRFLCRLIERCGAELMLHGHVRQATYHVFETASGQTPVIGATSASAASAIKERRACYFIYTFTTSESAWDINIAQRIYCPDTHRFIPGTEHHVQVKTH